MRRISSLVIVLLGLLLVQPSAARANAPFLTARAAALIDIATGRLLYAQNADERLYPASITKVLTALVAVEHGQLDQWLTVAPAAAGTEGSSMGLAAGERLRLRDLIYGLLLVSGNDAAETIAVGLAGSTERFAAWMNQTAKDLGATSSHFVNPHGLPDPNHYTTAADMARITRAALQNPFIRQVVATKRYTATAADGRTFTLYNENRLLGVNGVDGVKTGYTTAALHTYIGSATRGGHQLAAVVLRDTRDGKYDDAMSLLNWGFRRFNDLVLLAAGEEAGQVQVKSGVAPMVRLVLQERQPLQVLVQEREHVVVQVEAPAIVPAPVEAGMPLGILRLTINGRPAAQYTLVAAQSVAKDARVLEPAPVAGQPPVATVAQELQRTLSRLWQILAGWLQALWRGTALSGWPA